MGWWNASPACHFQCPEVYTCSTCIRLQLLQHRVKELQLGDLSRQKMQESPGAIHLDNRYSLALFISVRCNEVQ